MWATSAVSTYLEHVEEAILEGVAGDHEVELWEIHLFLLHTPKKIENKNIRIDQGVKYSQ